MGNSPSTLKTNELILQSLRLLELLSSTPDGRIPQDRALHDLGVTQDQLETIIELVGSLSDSVSGARPSVHMDTGELVLEGDAAQVQTLRLSPTTSALLEALLERDAFDVGESVRITHALGTGADDDTGLKPVLASESTGPFYALLSEAIEYGLRCILTYRSEGDPQPRERLVDPHSLYTEDGFSYLVAWDVRRDAQRLYRLDRLSAVTFTEDSVERHPVELESTHEHLIKTGERALLRFASPAGFHRLRWKGARVIERGEADGALQVEVHYSNEAWLFDQVLAGAGSIAILEPRALRERLVAYARDLASPAIPEMTESAGMC